MKRALLLAALFIAGAGQADSVLIRNATVHTMGSAGTLEKTDILVTDGSVAAIGRAVQAPAQARIIEADGHPVTPGLFGGLTHRLPRDPPKVSARF